MDVSVHKQGRDRAAMLLSTYLGVKFVLAALLLQRRQYEITMNKYVC